MKFFAQIFLSSSFDSVISLRACLHRAGLTYSPQDLIHLQVLTFKCQK